MNVCELKSAVMSQAIKDLDTTLRDVESDLNETLMWLPNLPHESVPFGTSAKENRIEKTWGEIPADDFPRLDHLELGKRLGLFDFERGAKIAGSGFPVYIGKGSKLERALINFMLDIQTQRNGYTEIFPPFTANEASLTGSGQLPKSRDDM